MKPKILIFVAYYLPGFKSGGPVRTISNLVEQLAQDFDFRIVTSDRDSFDTVAYPGVKVDQWQEVGKGWVRYVSPEQRSLRSLAQLISETSHDLLYLNSFFRPVFTLRPLLARRMGLSPRRPCVIAPRGEFAECALQYKVWKKRSFLLAARSSGLYSGLRWQASSEFEAEDIRRVLPSIARDVFVARDLPDLSLSSKPRENGPVSKDAPLHVVFLSRLARNKNLDFALDVLRDCPFPVTFDIWGYQEDEAYWRSCERKIATLPAHILVSYRGVAKHANVPAILSDYDLMLLPTQGENYGHVIAEALSVGTPVLISDRTPWRQLADDGVGWDLPLQNGKRQFVRALEEALCMRNSMSSSWNDKVRTYAISRLSDASAVEANRRLLSPGQ